MKNTAIMSVFCLALAGLAAPASAQEDREALRRQQSEIYSQLLERPDDPQLMLDYARVSIAIDDYEAAIATLERALIYEPGNPRTLLELGVSYYRVGSYQQAAYYLGEARAAGLDGEFDAVAARYLAEIDRRTQPSRFSGRLTAGLVYSSNANLAPDDQDVRFFGIDATLDPSLTSDADGGFRATANIRHVYDFGGATPDRLITDASAYTLHFFDESDGDIDVFSITSGPSLTLTERSSGPTMRPFGTVTHARSGNDALYTDFGGGVTFNVPVSPEFAAYGRLEGAWREYTNDSDNDRAIFAVEAGGAYLASDQLLLRGSVFFEREDADLSSEDNYEFGVFGSVEYSYAPGIEGIDQIWTFSGYAGYVHREYDDADPRVDPNVERNDDEFQVGVSHLFMIQDNIGVLADVGYFNRNSNIKNFDLDNLTGGGSLVLTF